MFIDEYLLYLQSLYWLIAKSGMIDDGEDISHHNLMEFIRIIDESGYWRYRA